MKYNPKLPVLIHFTMASCGGILGAYALFSRHLVFGSSQTANLIELIFSLLGRNPAELLIHLGALILYAGAVALSVILARKTRADIRFFSIFLEAAAVLISALIPVTVPSVIALYPVFFVTAFQWCAFKGANGFDSSTIFSTNNVKQTVLGLTEACLAKDQETRSYQRRKALFFGSTLLFFHIGAAAEYLALQVFSLRAVWLCFLPLAVGFLLVTADCRGKADTAAKQAAEKQAA